MATGKRYYWMKLKDTFMTSDAVDFLMSQPNGANYVVLYQMLCLKTINTGGKLSRQIGEIIIPYDEQKIARDTKWFSADTVRVALELYKALGLIYQDVDGNLVLVDHENLVGSETDYAEKTRRFRANKTDVLAGYIVSEDESQNALSGYIVSSDVSNDVSSDVSNDVSSDVSNDVSRNVSIDIRDKEKDIRDKSIDIEKEKEKKKKNDGYENVSDLHDDMQKVISFWNETRLPKVVRLKIQSQRGKMLSARLKEYGIEDVLKAVSLADESEFLQDQNWFDFGWFVRPENFAKVLEGKYNRNGTGENRRTGYSSSDRTIQEHGGEFRSLKYSLDPDDETTWGVRTG